MMNHKIIFGCLSSHIYASKFVKTCPILFFKKLLAVNLKGRPKTLNEFQFFELKLLIFKNIDFEVTYFELPIKNTLLKFWFRHFRLFIFFTQ